MCQACGGTCGGSARRRGRTTVDVNYEGRRLRISDAGGAEPLYVSRPLLSDSAIALSAWARASGLRALTRQAEMHVTIAYSKAPVDWFKFTSWSSSDPVVVPSGGPRRMEEFKNGVVVLRFASAFLSERWREFRDGGCSWDWPDYAPHVTVATDAGSVDLYRLKAFTGPLRFGPEEFAPVT